MSEEMNLAIEKVLNKVKESENINQLPTMDELLQIEFFDGEAISEIFGDETWINIKDGSKVGLRRFAIGCFNDRDHWDFYDIGDGKFICAECGLLQNTYEDIKSEVGYCDIFDDKALPNDWDINGVRRYFEKGVAMQEERDRRNEERWQRRWEGETKDCNNCINMVKGECQMGSDYDFESDECEDWLEY